MTYRELDGKANRLAARLRSLGVRPEVPVGICVERSFRQIVAILAVLRAGGAFLPLDPAWPDARVRDLLDDAEVPVIIINESRSGRLNADRRIVVDADSEPRMRAGDGIGLDDDVAVTPDTLAYIIYTSGSSGEPKGVEISHGNLLQLIAWHHRAFGVTATDRASSVASLGFDAAIWEVWPYLVAGASVSLAEDAVRRSPESLQDWLIAEEITVAFVPTAAAEPLLAADWPSSVPLRYLLTGGETLHSFPRPALPFAVVNNYGPTECTVVASSGVVASEGGANGLPTIGRPIPGTQLYLLDAKGRLVSPGEVGEIFIGGACVGRGYRNRPEQTAQAFLADRYGPQGGMRLYRTGDLGRQLPDGAFAFHGRADAQTKIRGHRVEPEEIVCVINRHPLVAASAVTVRGGARHHARLIAYIVPAPAGSPTVSALREYLASSLPEYMIPSTFVRVSALPLTTTGKIDQRALPEPNRHNALGDDTPVSPRSAAERLLLAVIGDISGALNVGVHDNFFLIGGHSLLGMQVVTRMRETFGVELTLRHLFEAKTVANLASTIEMLAVQRLGAMTEEEAESLLANSS